MLVVIGLPDASAADRKVDGEHPPKQSIITPTLIVLTIFFMLLSLSNAGIGNFGVVALMSGYGASFSSANIALTAFLGSGAIGVLAGGFLADRTRRHGQVAATCFAINAAIVFVIATVNLPSLLLTAAMGVAGFLGGVIAPSRDMLVRNAAPAGAAGRAFGIVSTGFNLGGIVSPLLFGWIMDQNAPHWVFGASVVFMILTVLLALVTDRGARANSEHIGYKAAAALSFTRDGPAGARRAGQIAVAGSSSPQTRGRREAAAFPQANFGCGTWPIKRARSVLGHSSSRPSNPDTTRIDGVDGEAGHVAVKQHRPRAGSRCPSPTAAMMPASV